MEGVVGDLSFGGGEGGVVVVVDRAAIGGGV